MRTRLGYWLACVLTLSPHGSALPAQAPFSPPPPYRPSLDSPINLGSLRTKPENSPGRAAALARLPINQGWYDPREHDAGSLLNRATDTLGEPINVIISACSSPDVLRESGFVAYSRSLGLWNECANLHLGDPQFANLGDGNGWQAELYEMRESWWPYVGSCLESIVGGNHFRAWKQNGTEADSGAWFLAASKEVDARGGHRIAHNGYNHGRDLIVAKAIKGTSYRGRTWETSVVFVEGLLPPGSEGVNHGIAQDGRVAVLTVREY